MINKGLRLKELREQKGMSQTEAARHIGVSKQTLYKYENNIITNIPSDIIEKIAVLYETTPAYLMGWQEQIKQFGESMARQLQPITEQFGEFSKALSDQLYPKTDVIAEIEALAKQYDATQLEKALRFTKSFLKATPDQQKIALEILQLHREDS